MANLRQIYGYSVMGDEDRADFSFNKLMSYDEATELYERNPRVSMMCEWIAGEIIKNRWKWKQDETIGGMSKDDYLEKVKFFEKIVRGIAFARLHGTSIAEKLEQDKDKLPNIKIWHRSNARTGWTILKEDLDEDGVPKQVTLNIYADPDDVASPLKTGTRKILLENLVVLANPKKGERWGGTPTAKMINHVAQLEELLLKLMGKHALDMVDNFFLIKGVGSEDEAVAIHEVLGNAPLREAYMEGDLDITPMSLLVQGKTSDFTEMIQNLKNFMANAMRVSAQSLDGAPEGTLSSAEFNTIISYAVIEQLQNHWKPYIEELLTKLGILYPDFEWNKPILKLEDEKQKTGSNDDE